MHDAADKVNEDEARAWELFEVARQERERREHAGRTRYPVVQRHCLECGEPVPEERLRVLPHTRRCVRCAERIERA